MGGLTAALWLAKGGYSVRLFEARAEVGGLASGIEFDGHTFDVGPYILLDLPGLEWAFEQVGLNFREKVPLHLLDEVYSVHSEISGHQTLFCKDLEKTEEGLERDWPGSGKKYRHFVGETLAIYLRLASLQRIAHPGLFDLLRSRAWRNFFFLIRPLRSVLKATGLPDEVCQAIGIWTHVAAQDVAFAPSPLALIPALIHHYGATYPKGGIRVIPQILKEEAIRQGVQISVGMPVSSLVSHLGQVRGVQLATGEEVFADAVLSDIGGLKTYLKLTGDLPEKARRKLSRLPLQSPGVCLYLAVEGKPSPPYLKFFLPKKGLCRLLIAPSVLDETKTQGMEAKEYGVRLVAPLRYDEAQKMGTEGQNAFADQLLEETWWREEVKNFRVLGRLVPVSWGERFALFGDSMNPAMTSRFMLQRRLPHKSPHLRGLYLAGSSTHPGQWVSFCAISGILAAEILDKDMRDA